MVYNSVNRQYSTSRRWRVYIFSPKYQEVEEKEKITAERGPTEHNTIQKVIDIKATSCENFTKRMPSIASRRWD